MTLTKAKIVERLFGKNLFTKTESAQIIETLFELMKQRLESREDILISGFGKFQLREKSRFGTVCNFSLTDMDRNGHNTN
jgi:integration host factor subunit alpha